MVRHRKIAPSSSGTAREAWQQLQKQWCWRGHVGRATALAERLAAAPNTVNCNSKYQEKRVVTTAATRSHHSIDSVPCVVHDEHAGDSAPEAVDPPNEVPAGQSTHTCNTNALCQPLQPPVDRSRSTHNGECTSVRLSAAVPIAHAADDFAPHKDAD